jgi:hypothetical protein
MDHPYADPLKTSKRRTLRECDFDPLKNLNRDRQLAGYPLDPPNQIQAHRQKVQGLY